MNEQAIIALVSSFLGGFVMTWLRGFSWFGEKITYAIALAGGIGVTAMIAGQATVPYTSIAWSFGIMSNTLAVLGGVKAGGDGARARAESTDMATAVLPQFNEFSNPKE